MWFCLADDARVVKGTPLFERTTLKGKQVLEEGLMRRRNQTNSEGNTDIMKESVHLVIERYHCF